MPRLLFCLFAVVALQLTGCGGAERQEAGPMVLAAASLQEALDAAADEWAAEGHARPVLSFAATSALARQVEAGAPGDVFISADEDWMDTLEADGHLAEGSRRSLAGNRLVLIAPADGAREIDLASAGSITESLGDGRLAIADPDAVPAGRYAKQALMALGQWEDLSDKLAIGENVRVALTLVSRGEAPLGIVYRTDARSDPNVRIAATFAPESHTPIAYPIARLAASSHPEAAAFESFLLSEDGQAIIRSFGFEPG